MIVCFIIWIFPYITLDKNSRTNGPAFAPFDNKPVGTMFTTGPCSKDEDCISACCDGTRCRAPDALTPGKQTCRDGLTPDFTQGLKFVKIAVAPAPPFNRAGSI